MKNRTKVNIQHGLLRPEVSDIRSVAFLCRLCFMAGPSDSRKVLKASVLSTVLGGFLWRFCFLPKMWHSHPEFTRGSHSNVNEWNKENNMVPPTEEQWSKEEWLIEAFLTYNLRAWCSILYETDFSPGLFNVTPITLRKLLLKAESQPGFKV